MNVGSRSVVESMVCNIVARNITQPIRVIAHEIYTAHVKPLEDALAKADAERGALVEALVDAESALSLMHHRKSDDLVCRALTSVCAALARVKGEVCPKD